MSSIHHESPGFITGKEVVRMKVIHGLSIILLIVLLLIAGCSPKASDSVILEVGTTKVTLAEYENFYAKNSGGWEVASKSSPEERERFLDLLTNYKLKLQDAFDRGLMNDSEVVAELRDYRITLASTFLVERAVTQPGLKLMYDRRLEEVRARHILFSLKADASPEDTLAAYNKAVDIIRQLKAGESFDSLAVKFSDDPSAKANFGDIYYFSSGQMVGSFENAVYNLKKGEIAPTPIRTQFGYHVIRVDDRQANPGQLKVRHIMTRFQSGGQDSADTAMALARITGAQDSLKNGWDFVKLAQHVSEDGGSAPQGGDLGWFERRRWVQPFDEAAFKLKPGQVSGIVRTPYGYHILRCDSAKPVEPFSVIQDELKRQYQQNRFQEDYQNYIKQLKREFNYSFDETSFGAFSALLDSTGTVSDSAWDAPVTAEVRRMTLMNVGPRKISVDTIITVLNTRPELRTTSLRAPTLHLQVDRIAEGLLLEAKAVGLENRYPEFASLMKDYNDGIVLYRAEQLEVWNQSSVSDSALRQYFEQNRSKFMVPEQVEIAELHFESDTLAIMVYDSLRQGADFTKLAARYNFDTDLQANGGRSGKQSATTNELTAATGKLAPGEFTEPVETENGYAIAMLIAKEPAREKSFEEAGAEVSNAYQEYQSKRLEQQWLDRVRQKHPVKQYKEHLTDAFKFPQATQ